MKKIISYILLALILTGLISVYIFGLHHYFSFTSLQTYHQSLQHWTLKHYFLSVCLYILIYILSTTLSVPGAIYLTIAGGYLFGWIATVYAIVSATIGATLLFFVVHTTLGLGLADKAKGWVLKMEKGFQENAFYYLLVLRLVPLFPFWAVNIVAALLNTSLKIFIGATFVGIIPGALVYVMVGNGLHTLLKLNQTPNLNIIFSLPILLPLLGLAILSLLPVIYKKWKRGGF